MQGHARALLETPSRLKRLVSVALSGVLCLSMIPAAAFAAEESTSIETATETQIEGMAPVGSPMMLADEQDDTNIAAQAVSNIVDALIVSGTKNYADAYEVLRLVNIERAKENLNPLVMDKELLEAAMLREAEISIDFSHTRPNGTSCYTASSKISGENIAAGSSTPEATMNQWMNSPGHRANILTARYTTLGVGAVGVHSSTSFWWVQLFGTEQNPSAAPQPANSSFTERIGVPESWLVNDNFSFRSLYYSVNVGETVQAWPRFQNQGWEYAVCELDAKTFQWKSSNTAIATVDSNGVITGKSAGTAIITATLPGTSVSFDVEAQVTKKIIGVWKMIGNSYYFQYTNGTYAKGWAEIEGKWYYFDAAGRMQTGWLVQGGTRYYLLASGAMATGWATIGGARYYFTPSTGAAASGLTQIDGYRYYFGPSSNKMATGWQTINGAKYYFSSSTGRAASGLVQLSGFRYYFGPSSNKMATGWQTISGAKYYFSSVTGKAASGLIQLNGFRYYFGPSSNKMATGWQTISGAKYYFSSVTGKAASGLVQLNGFRYYFGPSSNKMATGWQKLGADWYYFSSATGKAASGLVTIGGVRYYFGPVSNKMATGWQTIGDTRYYFNETSGALEKTEKLPSNNVYPTDASPASYFEYTTGNDGTVAITSFKRTAVPSSVTSIKIPQTIGGKNVVSAVVSGSSLSAIDISAATYLTSLDCSHNNLTSLNVSNNAALTSLNCDYNKIASLNVSNCKNLGTLSCEGNALQTIDLSRCTQLKELHCAGNALSVLDLSKCTILERVTCFGNRLTTLDVSNHAKLMVLGCAQNYLNTLNVNGCTSLQFISCMDNPLRTLDISTNKALHTLNAKDCSNLDAATTQKLQAWAAQTGHNLTL